MGTHESPLYRHAHFMIITCSLGQVIVKSAHWHTDSCCCLLGCSLPCYDLSIFFMLNAVPVRVSGQYLSLFCVVNWFPIINIYIHLHKASIFAHSHVDKSIKCDISIITPNRQDNCQDKHTLYICIVNQHVGFCRIVCSLKRRNYRTKQEDVLSAHINSQQDATRFLGNVVFYS